MSHRSKKPSVRRAALLGAGALLATALAVPVARAGTALEGCAAADAAIYQAPANVTAAPGTVLACRQVDALPLVGDDTPMTAWKVQYASTDGRGRPVAVSGTVVVPRAAWTGPGERPLVAFAPGTLGIGPQCAFSKQLAGEYQDAYEGGNIAALLRAGYAVAATDGAGYLDGQVHPYVSGADAGHAVLDIARAAPKVPGSGLSAAARVGLWGYSEGGAGSLWAAQLARSYAPGLNVVGVASGGVPGDLKVVAKSLDGGAFAGFLLDAVIGMATTNPEMPFDELLNDEGRTAVRDAKTLCLVGTLARFVGGRTENYTKDKLTLDQIFALRGPDGTTWGQIVDRNKLGAGVGPAGSGARYEIRFPVLQYRGLLDEVIPSETEEATRQAYCSARIPTQWNTYLGDHMLGDFQAVDDVVKWLGDRFAGKPMPGNC
ncbi:lipase family protein [Streptomyces sp. S.PNR 29]|uniref:lipase family protein n=1 Tax=Streptomyces sp. S.PNR 29 TaxID=2973805 RepID=UPI0025B17789|nr:lipase family protein [Streptomyces sp. S.PNR 29]MDN0198520.1 lipase family protein [Streptomyces sp. S.PNR 29]